MERSMAPPSLPVAIPLDPPRPPRLDNTISEDSVETDRLLDYNSTADDYAFHNSEQLIFTNPPLPPTSHPMPVQQPKQDGSSKRPGLDFGPMASVPVGFQRTRTITVEDSVGFTPEHHRLGCVRGVVIPTCEFMWSVLLFVRFGAITGRAGVLVSVVIICLCSACVSITSTSISAIATNGAQRGGGVHDILTRSLGTGLGGGIALLYYLGVMMLISVEVVGSVQGFWTALSPLHLTGQLYWDQVVVSCGAVTTLFFCAAAGKRVVHRIAMAFLLILVVSFISVYAGLVSARRIGSDRFGGRVTGLDFGTLGSNFLPSGDFVFRDIVSLVFPCFVGIYSGVNNMQQLRDPLRAIPKGMFSAIALSTTLYILLVVLLGASIQRDELLQNLIIEALVAWPTKWITIPGVLMVGLGAALQCMIISSNVLQSLASTDLFTYGRHLRLHRKWGDEPIPALVFTVALSYPFIFIVDLEKLAEVTTMCFLLCYGFTNFACFLMSAFKSPNWRPRYRKYHWLLSLTGMFLCVSLMFQIRWWAALAAIAVLCVASVGIQTSSDNITWGHGLHGLIFHLVLRHLVIAEDEEFRRNISSFLNGVHTKVNDPTYRTKEGTVAPEPGSLHKFDHVWRPQIVGFVRARDDGTLIFPRLLSFISQLKSRSALCILASIILDEQKDREVEYLSRLRAEVSQQRTTECDRQRITDDLIMARKLSLQQAMKDEEIGGFAKVFYAPSIRIGQRIMLQTVGLGELTPNTVLVSWPESKTPEHNLQSIQELQEMWQQANSLGLSSIICKGLENFPSNDQVMRGCMDVWWIVQDGQLLLLIAYLLRQHRVWKATALRLFALCDVKDNLVDIEEELKQYLVTLRIHVEELIVVPINLEHVDHDTVSSECHDTSLNLREALVSKVIQRELMEEDDSSIFMGHGDVNDDPPTPPDDSRPTQSQPLWPGEREPRKDAKVQTVRGMNDDESVDIGVVASSAQSGSHKGSTHSDDNDRGWFKSVQDNFQRISFVNACTILQLRNAMASYSSHASLVIFNLPPPDVEGQLYILAGTRRAGFYMELVETITSNFARSVLLYTGSKSKEVLEPG